MPFRPEKIADADVAAKKRKYTPSKEKGHADKARSRVNPGLAFTCFRALKERLWMKNDAEFTSFCWTGR